MATEKDRTTSVRRITNPDDKTVYVDLKVIDQMSFIDETEQGQEYQYTFNNGNDSNRQVHVEQLVGTDNISRLDVERIDMFSVTDAQSDYQESQFTLDGDEPPVHLVTHDVKIYSQDGNSYLVVRRTDQMSVTDAQSDYQESQFTLDNPDDDIGNPPPSLDAPDTSWDGTDINPPWRIDPFQSIIDVSWSGVLLVMYGGNKVATIAMSALDAFAKTGVLPVSMQKTLASSSWPTQKDVTPAPSSAAFQSQFNSVCQLALDTSGSTLLAPFTITVRGDGDSKIAVIAGSSTQCLSHSSNFSSFTPTLTPVSFPPLFNGPSGGLIFTTDGKYVLLNSVYVGASPAPPQAPCYAISALGSRYYGAYLGELSIPGCLFSIGAATVSQGDISKLAPAGDVAAIFAGASGYPVGGWWAQDGSVTALSGGNVTLNVPFPIFHQDAAAHVDTVGMTTMVVEGAGGNSGNTTYGSGSMAGWASLSGSQGSGASNQNTLEAFALTFPYGTGATGGKFYGGSSLVTGPGAYKNNFSSPNGSIAIAGSFKFGSDITAWLHVSNGKHVIQGINNSIGAPGGEVVQVLWLDGVDISTKLSAAIGVSVNEIQHVVMDFPSSIVGLLA
jgi:hypothetical protein